MDPSIGRPLFTIGMLLIVLSLIPFPYLVHEALSGSGLAQLKLVLVSVTLCLGISICILVAMSVRSELRSQPLDIRKAVAAILLVIVVIASIDIAIVFSPKPREATSSTSSPAFSTVYVGATSRTSLETSTTRAPQTSAVYAKNISIAIGVAYHAMEQSYDDWVKDIVKMKKLGISIIRLFYVAPSNLMWPNGDIDTEPLDTFLSLCDRYGMKVIVTIAQYVPQWIDLSMLMKDQRGDVFGWPSLCSRKFLDLMKRFVERVVEVCKHHRSVIGYNIFNELHLPENMYWDNRLCDYSSECIAMYRKWCLSRYGDELCNYIPKPRSDDWLSWPITNTTWIEAWYRWRLFFVELIKNVTSEMIKIVRRIDPDRPVYVNEMPWWFWSQGGYSAVSPRMFPSNVDYIGIDLYPAEPGGEWLAMALDAVRSLSSYRRGFVVMELNEKVGSPTPDEVGRWIAMALQMGAKQVIWFEWDDRFAYMDGGSYGLVDTEKELKPVAQYLSISIDLLSRLKPYLDRLATIYLETPSRIAMLYSEPNHILVSSDWFIAFDWLATYTLFSMGLGYKIDFVYAPNLSLDELSRYRILLASAQFVVDCDSLRAILRWVENGGILIADAYFASLTRCSNIVENLFGFKRIGDIDLSKRSYAANLCIDNTCVYISGYLDRVEPTTAKVIASYNGTPLVLVNRIGKGYAIYITMPLRDAYPLTSRWIEVFKKILAYVHAPRSTMIGYAYKLLRDAVGYTVKALYLGVTTMNKAVDSLSYLHKLCINDLENNGYVADHTLNKLKHYIKYIENLIGS